MTTALRGEVYSVDLGERKGGRHYFVVISNNTRNRLLDSVLAVMVTSAADKRGIPTAVEMSHDDPVRGFAMADDIVELYDDEVAGRPKGVLAPRTLQSLNDALTIVVGVG